jgi:hypothetical protein
MIAQSLNSDSGLSTVLLVIILAELRPLLYSGGSSGSKMIAGLKSGILVLGIPPRLASIGMIFVVRRRSSQVRRTDDRENPGQDW